MSAEHALPPRGDPVDPRRLATWASALAALVAALDASRWQRRVDRLLATNAPYDLKIADDHYWLEMEWARCWVDLQRRGQLPEMLTQRSVAALEFAVAVVATSRALSPAAQRVLRGRLRGGLNSGFADLYQELSMSAQLQAAGWTVRFADMEGTARHDIDAIRDGPTICVECKTLSADAGRKVHRRDFYRFATMAQPELSTAPVRGHEAIVVTMADRFPSSRPDHLAITAHVGQCTITDVGDGSSVADIPSTATYWHRRCCRPPRPMAQPSPASRTSRHGPAAATAPIAMSPAIPPEVAFASS